MYGYGSPLHEFSNRTKHPTKMSPTELKEECLARVRADKAMDPRIVELTERCLVNTAWVHLVRDSQAVKKWDSGTVTLVGDAVFKYVFDPQNCYIRPLRKNTY